MSAKEQLRAALSEAQARLDAKLSERQELHTKMTAAVNEMNAQGVTMDQAVLGIEGEVKALKALEASLGE